MQELHLQSDPNPSAKSDLHNGYFRPFLSPAFFLRYLLDRTHNFLCEHKPQVQSSQMFPLLQSPEPDQNIQYRFFPPTEKNPLPLGK